jgi:Tol biopolymer transport system component
VKTTSQVATVIATALLLAPLPGLGQPPPDIPYDQFVDTAQAARDERITQRFETNARVLTLFDREGRVTHTLGERAMYFRPVLSPDEKRVAVIKRDMQAQSADLWVLDVATGNGTRITSSRSTERAQSPVWSPDGSELAYVALRDSYFGIYRQAADGEGEEERLYQHSGGSIDLTDWSMDGRFLSFDWADLSGSVLYLFPLNGDGQAIEVARSGASMLGPRLSHDSRYLAYRSDETGTNEIFVRPVALAGGANASVKPWQVSSEGGLGMISWQQDGQELYYLDANRGVMAVPIDTAHGFEFGRPTLLFKAPDAFPVAGFSGGLGNVSRDGQRVVLAVPPVPKLQQITVLDRQGKVLSTVGEPGRYNDLALSPDGTRVAVARKDPKTGNIGIWTFDVASGQGTPIANDALEEYFAPIWSPDSNYVAYVDSISPRRTSASIYRKAWDGTGDEERLYQYTPGAWMVLTDWSADGKLLTFHDGCAGVLHVVPLNGDSNAPERPAIEWLRDEYDVAQARFSPDARFMAYLSDETVVDVFEVYVHPFDAGSPEASAGGENPVQVSTAGARGMIFWRHDGKELFYLTPDWEVMAVEVTTTPTFEAGEPRLLFKLPGRLVGDPQQWKNVSHDGQRFVFALDIPARAS